jgi:DHA1 family bicyclomycin/chloramphenicol resistance-like MFS transporter
MLGSLAGARILRAGRSPGAMLVGGGLLLAAGGALTAIGTRITALGIYGFLPPMLVYFFGIGMAQPSASALAMEPVPELAGTASAALGFVSYGTAALTGYLVTKLGGSSPRLFGAVVAGVGAAALALALLTALLRRRQR